MQIRGYLESCRNDHDEQGGPLTTDGGEVIMEETEYQTITQLKQVSMYMYNLQYHIQIIKLMWNPPILDTLEMSWLGRCPHFRDNYSVLIKIYM